MTPIRKGTARRLGLRPPISARVLALAGQCGIVLDEWQKSYLVRYYRP